MKGGSCSIHSTAACRAYVGEATPAAAEYHCNDFDWEDLKQEAEAMLAQRRTVQVTYWHACKLALMQTSSTLRLMCLALLKVANVALLILLVMQCTNHDIMLELPSAVTTADGFAWYVGRDYQKG